MTRQHPSYQCSDQSGCEGPRGGALEVVSSPSLGACEQSEGQSRGSFLGTHCLHSVLEMRGGLLSEYRGG